MLGPLPKPPPLAEEGRVGPIARSPRPARQALDRGSALREHERRSGAGIFRRWHGRGDNHGTLSDLLALRHRTAIQASRTKSRPPVLWRKCL